MDFTALLADLRDVAEKYKGRKTEPQVASTAYADMFMQILKRTQKMTDKYEDQITMLWVALNQLSTIYKDLSQDTARDQLTSFIFGMCAKTVLNIQWSQLDEDEKVKKDFIATVETIHENLKPLGYEKFQLILNLMESQWTHPILTQIMASEDDEIDDAEEYIKNEDPEILKLRIEIMMKENCEEFAFNLCEWSLKHPSLNDNLKIRENQIIILYRQQEYKRMQEVCSKIVCHDGIYIMSRLAKNTKNQDLCIRLAQVFLIQDWINPDRNCCTQELLKLWIHHQYLADKDEERFLDSIWTVAKVCRSTDQIGTLIDGVRRECGDMFIQLYTELCKYALNIDKGNMEQEQAKGNMEEVENRKRLVVRTCVRMAYMLKEYDFRMSRICGLTAFSLIPTTDHLNLVNKLYWTIKHTSVTSRNSKVNPATVYEVERLLGLMRAECLNPDYSWKQLIPVCKRYQLKKNATKIATSVKRTTSTPETTKKQFTKPNILSAMPQVKTALSSVRQLPEAPKKLSKQAAGSPRSLQRSHAEHLLAQNKNLSHEKVAQLAREKFAKGDQEELAEGPSLIVKELDKTINDLKKSLQQKQYGTDLAKKLSHLGEDKKNVVQPRMQTSSVSRYPSQNLAHTHGGNKVSLPSFQTIANKHVQGLSVSKEQHNFSAGTSKGTFNVLRPPGSANQECAKIAQQIAEMHEKQRREKEALEQIRIQGKLDGAKFALNSRNIPSSSQISDLLALTMKDKGGPTKQTGHSDAMTSNRPVAVQKPDKVLKRNPVNKGQTPGGSSNQGMNVTSSMPQKHLKTQKYYLATENVMNKLDSSGNLNLGDSKVSIKPVLSMVVPKSLTNPDNQQQLMQTVTNMVKKANILPESCATHAVVGDKIVTCNSNTQNTVNYQYGNAVNTGTRYNTVQNVSTVQNYATNSMMQRAISSPIQTNPQQSNMPTLPLNQNSFPTSNIVMEVQNIPLAAVSQNTVPVLQQSNVNQPMLNMQQQQYQQFIQSPVQTPQVDQQYLQQTFTQPQQYTQQSGYSQTVYQQQQPVMSTQHQVHQQQLHQQQAVHSNLQQNYGSVQNVAIPAYSMSPNATPSFMQVQQTPDLQPIPQQVNYNYGCQNDTPISNTMPVHNGQAVGQNQSARMKMGNSGIQQDANKTGNQTPSAKQFITPPELSPAVVQQIFASLKQGNGHKMGAQNQVQNKFHGQVKRADVDQSNVAKDIIRNLALNKKDETVKKSVLEATQKILELRQQFGQRNETVTAADTKGTSSASVPDLPDLGSKEFEIDSILNLEETSQQAQTGLLSAARQTPVGHSNVMKAQTDKEMLNHIEQFLEIDGKSDASLKIKKHVNETEIELSSQKQAQSTYLNANRIAKEREKSHTYHRITCKYCGMFFKDENQLYQHIDRNLCHKYSPQSVQESNVSCSICKGNFTSLNELKDHIKRSCRPQSKEAGKQNFPLRDFEYSLLYKCSNCVWMNANEKMSNKHMEDCTADNTSKSPAKLTIVYKCRMCSDIFFDKETTYRHVSKLCPHLKAFASQKEAQETVNRLRGTNKLLWDTNKTSVNSSGTQGINNVKIKQELGRSKSPILKPLERNSTTASPRPDMTNYKVITNAERIKTETCKEIEKSDSNAVENVPESSKNDLEEMYRTQAVPVEAGSNSNEKADTKEPDEMKGPEMKRLQENLYLEQFKALEMKRKALKEKKKKDKIDANKNETINEEKVSVKETDKISGQEIEDFISSKKRKTEIEPSKSDDHKNIAHNVKKRRKGDQDDRTEKGLRAKKHIKQKKYLIDEMEPIGKQVEKKNDEAEPIKKQTKVFPRDEEFEFDKICKFCSFDSKKSDAMAKHYVLNHMVGYRPMRQSHIVCQFCNFEVKNFYKEELIDHVIYNHKQQVFTQVNGTKVRLTKEREKIPPLEIQSPKRVPTRSSVAGSRSHSVYGSPKRMEKLKKHIKALAMRKKCAENLQKIARKKLYTSGDESGEEDGTSFSENASETEPNNKNVSKAESVSRILRNMRRMSDTTLLRPKSSRSPSRSEKTLPRMRSRSSSQSSRSSFNDSAHTRLKKGPSKEFMLTRSGRRNRKTETDSSYVTESSNIEDVEMSDEDDQMSMPQPKRKLTRRNSKCSDRKKSTNEKYFTDSSDDSSVQRFTRSSGLQPTGGRRFSRDKSKKGEKTKNDKRNEKEDKKGKGSRQTSVSDDEEYYSSATDMAEAISAQKIQQLKQWLIQEGHGIHKDFNKTIESSKISSESGSDSDHESGERGRNYSLRKRQNTNVYKEYESSDIDNSDTDRKVQARRRSPRQLPKHEDSFIPIKHAVRKSEYCKDEKSPKSVLIGPDDDEFIGLKHAPRSDDSLNTSENKENEIDNQTMGVESSVPDLKNVAVMESDDEFAFLQSPETACALLPNDNNRSTGTGTLKMLEYNSEFQRFTSQRQDSTSHRSSESEEEDTELSEDDSDTSYMDDVPVLPPKKDFGSAFTKFARLSDKNVIEHKLFEKKRVGKCANFISEFENFFSSNKMPEIQNKIRLPVENANFEDLKRKYGIKDCSVKLFRLSQYSIKSLQKSIKQLTCQSKFREYVRKRHQHIYIIDSASSSDTEQECFVKLERIDVSMKAKQKQKRISEMARLKSEEVKKDQTLIQDIIVPGCVLSEMLHEADTSNVAGLSTENDCKDSNDNLSAQKRSEYDPDYVWIENAESFAEPKVTKDENTESFAAEPSVTEDENTDHFPESPRVTEENSESFAEPRGAEDEKPGHIAEPSLTEEELKGTEVVIVTDPGQAEVTHDASAVEHAITETLEVGVENVITFVEDCIEGHGDILNSDDLDGANIVFIELDDDADVIIAHGIEEDYDVTQQQDNTNTVAKTEIGSSKTEINNVNSENCQSETIASVDDELVPKGNTTDSCELNLRETASSSKSHTSDLDEKSSKCTSEAESGNLQTEQVDDKTDCNTNTVENTVQVSSEDENIVSFIDETNLGGVNSPKKEACLETELEKNDSAAEMNLNNEEKLSCNSVKIDKINVPKEDLNGSFSDVLNGNTSNKVLDNSAAKMACSTNQKSDTVQLETILSAENQGKSLPKKHNDTSLHQPIWETFPEDKLNETILEKHTVSSQSDDITLNTTSNQMCNLLQEKGDQDREETISDETASAIVSDDHHDAQSHQSSYILPHGNNSLTDSEAVFPDPLSEQPLSEQSHNVIGDSFEENWSNTDENFTEKEQDVNSSVKVLKDEIMDTSSTEQFNHMDVARGDLDGTWVGDTLNTETVRHSMSNVPKNDIVSNYLLKGDEQAIAEEHNHMFCTEKDTEKDFSERSDDTSNCDIAANLSSDSVDKKPDTAVCRTDEEVDIDNVSDQLTKEQVNNNKLINTSEAELTEPYLVVPDETVTLPAKDDQKLSEDEYSDETKIRALSHMQDLTGDRNNDHTLDNSEKDNETLPAGADSSVEDNALVLPLISVGIKQQEEMDNTSGLHAADNEVNTNSACDIESPTVESGNEDLASTEKAAKEDITDTNIGSLSVPTNVFESNDDDKVNMEIASSCHEVHLNESDGTSNCEIKISTGLGIESESPLSDNENEEVHYSNDNESAVILSKESGVNVLQNSPVKCSDEKESTKVAYLDSEDETELEKITLENKTMDISDDNSFGGSSHVVSGDNVQCISSIEEEQKFLVQSADDVLLKDAEVTKDEQVVLYNEIPLESVDDIETDEDFEILHDLNTMQTPVIETNAYETVSGPQYDGTEAFSSRDTNDCVHSDGTMADDSPEEKLDSEGTNVEHSNEDDDELPKTGKQGNEKAELNTDICSVYDLKEDNQEANDPELEQQNTSFVDEQPCSPIIHSKLDSQLDGTDYDVSETVDSESTALEDVDKKIKDKSKESDQYVADNEQCDMTEGIESCTTTVVDEENGDSHMTTEEIVSCVTKQDVKRHMDSCSDENTLICTDTNVTDENQEAVERFIDYKELENNSNMDKDDNNVNSSENYNDVVQQIPGVDQDGLTGLDGVESETGVMIGCKSPSLEPSTCLDEQFPTDEITPTTSEKPTEADLNGESLVSDDQSVEIHYSTKESNIAEMDCLQDSSSNADIHRTDAVIFDGEKTCGIDNLEIAQEHGIKAVPQAENVHHVTEECISKNILNSADETIGINSIEVTISTTAEDEDAIDLDFSTESTEDIKLEDSTPENEMFEKEEESVTNNISLDERDRKISEVLPEKEVDSCNLLQVNPSVAGESPVCYTSPLDGDGPLVSETSVTDVSIAITCTVNDSTKVESNVTLNENYICGDVSTEGYPHFSNTLEASAMDLQDEVCDVEGEDFKVSGQEMGDMAEVSDRDGTTVDESTSCEMPDNEDESADISNDNVSADEVCNREIVDTQWTGQEIGDVTEVSCKDGVNVEEESTSCEMSDNTGESDESKDNVSAVSANAVCNRESVDTQRSGQGIGDMTETSNEKDGSGNREEENTLNDNPDSNNDEFEEINTDDCTILNHASTITESEERQLKHESNTAKETDRNEDYECDRESVCSEISLISNFCSDFDDDGVQKGDDSCIEKTFNHKSSTEKLHTLSVEVDIQHDKILETTVLQDNHQTESFKDNSENCVSVNELKCEPASIYLDQSDHKVALDVKPIESAEYHHSTIEFVKEEECIDLNISKEENIEMSVSAKRNNKIIKNVNIVNDSAEERKPDNGKVAESYPEESMIQTDNESYMNAETVNESSELSPEKSGHKDESCLAIGSRQRKVTAKSRPGKVTRMKTKNKSFKTILGERSPASPLKRRKRTGSGGRLKLASTLKVNRRKLRQLSNALSSKAVKDKANDKKSKSVDKKTHINQKEENVEMSLRSKSVEAKGKPSLEKGKALVTKEMPDVKCSGHPPKNDDMTLESKPVLGRRSLSKDLQKNVGSKNDAKRCSKSTVGDKKEVPTVNPEDEEEEFIRRTETMKRARRKSATLMQPYVSDFNFESSNDHKIMNSARKQEDIHSNRATKTDSKIVRRRNKMCLYHDRKDTVVNQETVKPKCNRDFTEEIKMQMRPRSKEIQGHKTVSVPSPVRSVVTSERPKTYLKECSVPIFSPHIFTCDSVKKLTRQKLTLGNCTVNCSSSSIPCGKLTQDIKELKQPTKGNALRSSRYPVSGSCRNANQFTRLKPRRTQQQPDSVKLMGLTGGKASKTQSLSDMRLLDTCREGSEGTDTVGTRSRSRLSLQNDSGIEVDSSMESPTFSEPDSEEKLGKVRMDRKSRELAMEVTQKLSLSSRKRTRVGSKLGDKFVDEPVTKALKPDGTTQSPEKPDKDESDMCKHRQLVTQCDTCTRDRRSRTTSPMPLYDNSRKTVRQIIHGGKVFEITKGSVTEREIQRTRKRAKQEKECVTAGSSPIRGRTRGTKPSKPVSSPAKSDSSEGTGMEDLTFGGKRKDLNDYIHDTLKEIRKQRDVDNPQKWTVKKESVVKAPKFPYAFKKTRRN